MDQIKKKVLLGEWLLLAVLLFLGWRLRFRSLYFAMQISEFLLLMAVLERGVWIDWSARDLLAVACAMLFDNVVLHLLRLDTPAFLHIVPFLFLLSLELLVLVRGVWRRKRGYGILVGYGVLCCLAALFVYRQWERFILDYYLVREGVYGFPVKAIYLLVCMAIGAVLLLFLLHWLNMFLGKWLQKVQEYSATYVEIDRSIVLVLLLTLGTLLMRELVRILTWYLPPDNELHLLPFLPLENSYDIPLLLIGFSVMIVLIQVIYIRLLVKSISMKEEMRLQEKDLHDLAEYNHELENHMDDMRGIRHDIKNMFLIMGGFVDRSNDQEMKAFYAENIVPFADIELRKNDLYGKLACIRSEGMKSFLYFKVMQGIEQNVPIDLQVQLVDIDNTFGMGQTDLIRILGILIDNGVEEAKSCKGRVAVSLKEKEQEYLFAVSNTVRPRTKEKGVAAGITDKGPGRGNGLLIAEKLIGKYRNVLLNSYFREEEFVQCLRIAKTKT